MPHRIATSAWFLFIVLAIMSAQIVQMCDFEKHRPWAKKRLAAIGKDFSEPCQVLSGGFKDSTFLRDTTIKAFLFQNDERELLADWLQYHSYLFGIKNLYVVDHMSTGTDICNLLTLYSICGMKVSTFDKAFEKKHIILSSTMRHEAAPNTFLVPLDADEFVVHSSVEHQSRVSLDRETILSGFMKLTVDGHKYKFREVLPIRLNNATCTSAEHYDERKSGAYRRVMHTGYAGPSMWRAPISKTFFSSKGFLGTDQGNHIGHAEIDKLPGGASNLTHYIVANVSIVHLGVSTYDSMKQKAIRGAAAYGYNDTTNCSAISSGRHYCQRAKLFRHQTPESSAIYRADCVAQDSDVPFTSMHEWFAAQTLTLRQLVGDEVVVKKAKHVKPAKTEKPCKTCKASKRKWTSSVFNWE